MAPSKSKLNSKSPVKKTKKLTVEIGKAEDDDNKPGCVYLGHIPHGFYEKQMLQYFSQFGKVLDVKVCRSKKTKNSKGYGFVKFKYSAVAKTVAETCHNYLFLSKLLKCEYKPMSEIHKGTFKKGSKPINVPKSLQNNVKDEYRLALSAKRSISRAEKKLQKLKSSGLSFDLNDITDIPDVSKLNDAINAGKFKKDKLDETITDRSDAPSCLQPSAKRRKTDSSPPSHHGRSPQKQSPSRSKILKISSEMTTKDNESSVVPVPKKLSKMDTSSRKRKRSIK